MAYANRCIDSLRRLGAFDPQRRLQRDGQDFLITITEVPTSFDITAFGERLEAAALEPTASPTRPFEGIRESAHRLGLEERLLPRRWERIGDVVLLRPPKGVQWDDNAPPVAAVYGETLGAKTVVEDLASIRGPWRLPTIRWLWGDSTETLHTEDGVRFALDVAKVMFSSGNLPERVRIARVPRDGETVVDLFAGIGYFAVPMAVHSRASRIVACEMNPTAFDYLQENIRRNRVGHVEPRLGDCRDVAPDRVADRVIIGHFDAHEYLDVVFAAAKKRATIHMHSLLRARGEWKPERALIEAARRNGYTVAPMHRRVVKSYGPRTWHLVLEAMIVRA